jgi:peptidoglycan/LPS O-acetylase OafA/YrhL
MNLASSLYLDIVRAGAAFVVFLGHYSLGQLSGGLFWQVSQLGHYSVLAFFVLSGLVIGHTVEHKDTDLRSYTLSRLARLYSVVFPAIVLTFVVDTIGHGVRPQLYDTGQGFEDNIPVLRAFAALFFLSEFWFWHIEVFSNFPYWSLPFEFWYYVFFGAVYFLRGNARWAAALGTLCIAGPQIVLLMPVWFMGYYCYQFMTRVRLGEAAGALLFFGSLTGLALIAALDVPGTAVSATKNALAGVDPGFAAGDLFIYAWSPAEYAIGMLFAANFVGFHVIGHRFLPLLVPLKKQIRWCAGLTFPFYLFHMPLLFVFTAVSPWAAGDWRHRIFLMAAVPGATYLLCYVSEYRRAGWRALFDRIIPHGLVAAVPRRA